ncbi:hypothetical protein BDV98DRAFT_560535 [Pterulicium gracile]|uniref:VanZ-like domain-containing protein n=1 Tax=Pterulicium gracile TaxID=1884261 RepID=A0A5C3R4B3_9AGAR|nr:hypothetical protein BDV98DRAFT_560535 [Pterula gracilis]
MKSTKFRVPKYDLPIRIRLWFIALACVIMVILALLGFTQSAQSWISVNDKVLHFTCFALATGVMYFVVDVDEDARSIWIWRNLSMLFTLFACFFCGGIVSEFVQSMLPYKTFQWGDIVANLIGCSCGLLISYHLEKQYRHRREIQRLYQPISTAATSRESFDSDDDEAVDATQLLPLHYPPRSPAHALSKTGSLRNVWDAREEIFGIGDSDDGDYDGPRQSQAKGGDAPDIPKIHVTHS